MQLIELPYTPAVETYFIPIAHDPWSIWLDSNQWPDSRYDILVTKPKLTLTTFTGSTHIQSLKKSYFSQDDPFELLRQHLSERPLFHDLPFIGGAVGYFGYELGNTAVETKLPTMAVGIYDSALIIDHHKEITFFISRNETSSYSSIFQLPVNSETASKSFKLLKDFQSNFTKVNYTKAFEKIIEHIKVGDCYQVNLSQCFSAPYAGDLWSLYCALRKQNSAPFAAYMNLPDTTILSFSPERFLLCDQGLVETKPIKGTRKRIFSDPTADLAAQQNLIHSEKDRAENLMIVDLLRNDLGKSCAYGSIQVPKLFSLESFTNVHHLVSTVTGKLAENKTPIDLLKDAFPGGSITGAPKIKVMEIISKLEPHPREIYCGSIGYISSHGRMDSNIAIRSCYTHEQKIYCAGGGGIVIDSDSEDEYQESINKIERLMHLCRVG